MRAAIAATALAAWGLGAGGAAADAGAIAYDPRTGLYGVAWRAASAAEAAAQAQRDCAGYGGACDGLLSFSRGCGALARGGGASMARDGGSIAAAEAAAMGACGAGCEIVVSLCSDD